MAFTIVTVTEDEDSLGDFCIQAPDDTEGEWAGTGEIATLEYDGAMYFATDCDEFAGMKAGVVYRLGEAQATEAADYDADEGEEEDEDEDDDEQDAATN